MHHISILMHLHESSRDCDSSKKNKITLMYNI